MNPRPRILLVTASGTECQWLRTALLKEGKPGAWENARFLKKSMPPGDGISVKFLVTGIGMVNTAYYLGRALLHDPPDLAIQLGIAGSFPGTGPGLEEVVEIGTEIFAELGAQSPEGFLDLEKMGFENFRHAGGVVYNELGQPAQEIPGLRRCRSITVNEVHGIAPQISEIQKRWSPEVENMEGAAFFECCLLQGIPFRAFRGISNWVEPRNRANWAVTAAADNVQQKVYDLLLNNILLA